MTSNRQLKVGETIKRVLSDIVRNEIFDPALEGVSIIISEVRISPDLRNATIFVLPMIGGKVDNESFVKLMNDNVFAIRRLLCKKVHLRVAPDLYFKIDKSFDEASKIEGLIKK